MADSTIPTAPEAPREPSPSSYEPAPAARQKSFLTTWLLALLLGTWGIDRFYLGKVGTGILKLVTAGGVGVWSLVDLILVLAGRQTDRNGRGLEGYSRNKVKAIIITIALYVLGWGLVIAASAGAMSGTATIQHASASDASASATSPTTASRAATPTQPSAPSTAAATPTATPTSATSLSSLPVAAPAAASSLAPQPARDAAAAILVKAGEDFRAWFEQGAAMSPSSQQIDWYTGYSAPDQVEAMQTAFSAADKNFNADDEPSSIDAWRDAATTIPGDIQIWYFSNNGSGQDPALTAKVEAEFASIASLARDVQAGK